MEVRINRFFLSVLVSLMALVSCVQEANDGSQRLDGTVADLSGQVASLNSSLEQLNALQNTVELDLSELSAEIEAHIGYLKSGVSRLDGTMATLQLQKNVAMVVAELQAAGYSSSVTQFVKSVKSWLGKSFETYFDVLVYACASQTIVEGAAFQLGEHHSYVDAVLSDVEAGLRDGVPAEELATVLETLAADLTSATELNSKVDEILLDLETECVMAVEALFDESSSYDASALKKASTQARIQLKSTEPTISDLVDRIEDIETAIEGIKSSISGLRADVDELLGMIQSLTYLSEFSEEMAIAYYNLNPAVVDAEGRQGRTPVENFQLNYLVRPASAVTALADMSAWGSNGLDVSLKGYFANMIEVKSFDRELVDFTIDSVTADAEKGLLSISVNSSVLTEDFFMKKTGAKLALFVQSATTDLASRFVEIVPRDQSGKVYVEALTLDARSLEIKQGDSDKLIATLNPSGVTIAGCDWSSSVPEVASVDANGKITANIVGKAVITATTKGTNEWGQKLTATCNVVVLPNAQIVPSNRWVEVGETIDYSLNMSDNFQYTGIKWWLSNDLASIDNSGTVTGQRYYIDTEKADGGLVVLKEEYRYTVVYCGIYNGGLDPEVTLTDTIRVVANQPRGIDISGLKDYDNPNEIKLKFGQVLDLGTMSVTPETVNTDLQPGDDQQHKFYVTAPLINWATDIISYNDNKITAGVKEGSYQMRFTVSGSSKYFAPGHGVNRYVNFIVEPYYVKDFSIPEVITLYTGDETQISPVFISDIKDHLPSDTSVEYSLVVEGEYGEDVVEIEGSTIKAGDNVGQAKVRVTSLGATEDGVAISKDCIINVINRPVASAKVGDYYYSDGTYSTTFDANKTLVGIVFSTTNALHSDTKLAVDHGSCGNGLVVCTTEASVKTGSYAEYTNGSNISIVDYFVSNGWPVPSKDVETYTVMGYYQTLALKGYRSYRGGGEYLYFVGAVDNGPDFSFAEGKTNSDWYIPSYKEMSILRDVDVMTTVNNSMKVVNESKNPDPCTEISENGVYFISTAYDSTSDKYNDLYINPYSMSKGTWKNSGMTGRESAETVYTLRLVLAF